MKRNDNDAVQKIDRRTFLRLTGIAGGGLILGVTVGCSPEEAAEQAATPTGLPEDPVSLNAYVQITADGIVIQSPNPEIGQGVNTSLPMIVAEELDAAWEDVTVVQAETHPRFDRQMSGGSRSIPTRWMPLRQAGATARHMLVAAAALQWEVDAAECETRDSMVIHAPTGRQLSYMELANSAAAQPVPDLDEITLKDPSEFRLLGKRVTGSKNLSVVTGDGDGAE